MEIEFNPFRLNIPSGGPPITSLTVSSSLDWLDIPDVVIGPDAVLTLNPRDDISQLHVFATGAGVGSPSMRPLLAAHIPNIEISQVNGLQGAINSIVKSFSSTDASILVQNNGIGYNTITPIFGTVASTIAQGNDTRFPASVTGLRKGAGVGSADTAAVAKTDYWDVSTFVASGSFHAKGLVPDPGASAGSTHFLCENGNWVVPAGSGTVTSVALTAPAFLSVAGSPVTTTGTLAVTLATQSANTIFAGPTTGSAAAPTFRAPVYADVSPLVGSGSSTIAAGNDARFPCYRYRAKEIFWSRLDGCSGGTGY